MSQSLTSQPPSLAGALRTQARRPTRAVAGGLVVVAHAQLMSLIARRDTTGVSHMMTALPLTPLLSLII